MPSVHISEENVQTRTRSMQVNEDWQEARADMMRVYVEMQAPKSHCTRCGNILDSCAGIRCLDCGSSNFLCSPCCEAVHEICHFHKPEIWKVMSNINKEILLYIYMYMLRFI